MSNAQKTFDILKKAGKPLETVWGVTAGEKLHGRRIDHVRYLTDEEADDMGWDDKPLVLILDDGNYIFPMRDDEGNGAGALATSWDDLPTIPVI